jgi:hypothetical protein
MFMVAKCLFKQCADCSISIYERALRDHLKLRKKKGVKDWIVVERHAARRKQQEGKDTEVFLSGVRKDWTSIKRAIGRNARAQQERRRVCRGKSNTHCCLSNYVTTPIHGNVLILNRMYSSSAPRHYHKNTTATSHHTSHSTM